MRILIVEDELPTAEDIEILVKSILKEKVTSTRIETTLENALFYLQEKPIDVLLLDLNLNSLDGFKILKELVSKSFHTIIISANTDRALEAFEYGVLDFIPKPYNKERISSAFNRLKSNTGISGRAVKYLSIKKGFEIYVVPIVEIVYFKSANIYCELHLKNGKTEIYDKSIKNISALLPMNFFRIHKSYNVNLEMIDKIIVHGGGRYNAVLKTKESLPVSRQKISTLKKLLDM